MFTIFRRLSLVSGIVLLIGASLGCSFWFYYSFFDGATASPHSFTIYGISLHTLPVVAGLVGCGAQLFVYAFIGNVTRVDGVGFKLVLITVSILTMALTIVSTYSTLTSMLLQKETAATRNGYFEEQKRQIIESRSRDMDTLSTAANQAVRDRYRSQGKQNAESNEQLRREQLLLLEQLSSDSKSSTKATPIDSLVKLFGDNERAKNYFCIWIAVMFELLPILGIAMQGKLEKVATLNTRRFESIAMERNKASKKPPPPPQPASTKNETYQPIKNSPIVPLQHNQNTPDRPPVISESFDASRFLTDKPLVYRKLKPEHQNQSVDEIDDDVLYPVIIQSLYEKDIPLSYAGVREFTGLSKWKVQRFFHKVTEDRIIVNRSDWAVEQGYTFSKLTRYHLNRDYNVNDALKLATQE